MAVRQNGANALFQDGEAFATERRRRLAVGRRGGKEWCAAQAAATRCVRANTPAVRTGRGEQIIDFAGDLGFFGAVAILNKTTELSAIAVEAV